MSLKQGMARSMSSSPQEDVYTDVSRLMELNKEKESIQKELEVLYEKWEELAE